MIKEEKIEKNQNKEKQIEILLLVSAYECFALSTTGVYVVYHSFYSYDFLNPDKPFNYDDIKKKKFWLSQKIWSDICSKKSSGAIPHILNGVCLKYILHHKRSIIVKEYTY